MTKVFLELLVEDECQDGVRAEPHKGRNVSLVKCQRSLAGGEADQVEGTWNKNAKNTVIIKVRFARTCGISYL